MISKSKIKRIKRLPYVFLAMVVVYLFMFLLRCSLAIGDHASIAVEVKQLKEKTYTSVNLGTNRFQTGTEGKLSWKVNSFKESFLIETANPNAIIKLVDLTYLLLLVIIIFISVSGINEYTDMRTKVYKLMITLAYLVILYPALILADQMISERIIEYLTGKQFTSQRNEFHVINYMTIATFLIVIGGLVKRKENVVG